MVTQQQQQIHPYYELLPSYISPESIRSECDELVVKAQETLERFDELRGARVQQQQRTEQLQKRHFRALETIYKLKHELPKELHLKLIHALVSLLWERKGRDFDDVHMELRAVKTLHLLIGKWTKRSAGERSELVLDWRSGWSALERTCFSSKGRIRQASQPSLQQLGTETVKCIEQSRKFFQATDASTPLVTELWSEFSPIVKATESNACFKALALFSLFAVVPANNWSPIEQLLPDWFSTWNSVSKCAEWDGHWMKIMSRVAKKYPGASAWDQYLPFLFAKIHDSLDLPSDLGAPFKSNTWPSAYNVVGGGKRVDHYAMRLSVYLLRNPSAEDPQAAANQYVLEILNLMKAFFHPSNVANSANTLGVSVYFFSNMLARRLGHEKVQSSGVDESARLKLETCHPLLDSLLELSFFGIYSKNRSVASKCMYLIKNLVCIDPAHCASPVLQEMLKGLDPTAMSHSHLASTAISTMGVILYHLMCGKDPKGTGLFFSTYLSPVLTLTLPGIDANDEKKTVSTISLYFHLFSWLPLVNDTGKSSNLSATKQRGTLSKNLFDEMTADLFAEIKELSGDADQKMWELGAFLEEWSLSLLDRCFEFIKSRVGQTEGSSQSRNSGSKRGHGEHGSTAKHNGNEDSIVLEILNLMGMLYLQMSPEIYAQAVRKTLRFVSNVFFTSPFGGKVISNLIHACVQADPSQSFAPFMAQVLEKLHATKNSINVSSLMTNEKMWYLHMFDGVVRSNGAEERLVLQYQAEIRAILSHFLNNEEEKDIYEAAGTVLDHLLASLVNVYPTEFRSLPPTEWSDAVSNESGMFQYLGTAVTWKRLSISWHEPEEQELAFAYQLLEEHVLRSLESLATCQTEKDRAVRSWVPRLKQINSAIHGARNIFVNSNSSSESLLASGSLPLLKKALGTNVGLLENIVGLKETLMKKTHEIVVFWQENGTGSTIEIQIWQAIISIIHQVLVARGEHLERHRYKEKQNMYIKATTLDVASEALRRARKEYEVTARSERAPLSSRNEMIERVLHFYSKRKVQEHFELAHHALFEREDAAHRELHEALLADLEVLMKNPYEGIHSDATTVMKEMSELYSKWLYARVPKLLDVLEGTGSDGAAELKEETISGVLKILSRPLVIKYLWKNRDQFFGRVVKAVLKSNDALLKRIRGESSKLQVGVQVEAFYMAVLGSWRYVRGNSQSTTLLETLLAAEPSPTEHWKFQLVHLVSLYPLLQPHEMPLPLDVWKLTIKQLSNEVLPVRQVALLLYAQLVKLHKRGKLIQSRQEVEAVESVVYSKDTMKAVVDAFVTNHKNMNRFAASADGQHANSAPTNWSFGVDDVLRSISGNSASFPKAAPLSSVRLLNQSSDMFRSVGINSTKLIQKLVQINPIALSQSGVIEYLHELATEKTDAKINQEDRQAALTTLSEWVAGLLRGFLKTTSVPESEALVQIASVVEIFKKVLPQVSVSLVEPWGQVLYLVSRPSRGSSLPLDRLLGLVSYLVEELEQSFVRATAEDYARQVKWLVLIESLATHLLPASASSPSSPAYPLAKELSARVIRVINQYALTHQYKIIRDRVGKMLFLLGVYGFAPESSSLASVPVDASTLPLQKLVAAAALADDGSEAKDRDDDESDEGKIGLYARETAMQWLACTEKFGDTQDVLAVMKELFPVAFLSQNHPKAEVAVFAKNTTNAIASSLRLYFPPNDPSVSVADLDNLFVLLDTFAVHRFWKTRGAVLRFLTTFGFYHWIFFSAEQRDRVQTLVSSFLTDEQREVQEMAKYTLRSLIHNQRPEIVEALSMRWTEQALETRIVNPKTKRRIARLESEAGAGSGNAEELESARKKLKTNEDIMVRSVLGMCAVILAFPHTLPVFVPSMFEELGKFLYLKNRSVMVSYLEKAVKETLLEFKRTHQDNWLETKSKFTAAQLNVIEDVSISPGYYTDYSILHTFPLFFELGKSGSNQPYPISLSNIAFTKSYAANSREATAAPRVKMGGNKHKNGIVCIFPGCDKTMRTQKFKLHFTKQHLKPGEVYNVEHRRRFEVARDEEYASDTMSPHKLEQHLQVSVQIPSSYQVAAAAAASAVAAAAAAAVGSTGMTPTFTPIASTVGVADATTTADSVVAESAAADVNRPDVNLSSETEIQQAQQEQQQQQRMSRLTALQARAANGRFGCILPAAATATDMASPLTNKRAASALEPASVDASVTPSPSDQSAQDLSRAVLVQYIEMMDQRFHELIEKMGQVIDGQRELIDMLRKPVLGDTAQLLEQTPTLSHVHSQLSSPGDTLNADGSAKKRRKSNSGAELQQQQTNGAIQRPSSSSTALL